MNWIDWLVLLGTLGFIAAYGVWKTRRLNSLEGYLKGNDESWATIGLSVMATQASAITFLSVPGQAYEQGLGFVQFYFGMPIALVILSITFIPIYYRLKVYTAYEYLEHRFDLKTRLLAAFIFLLQRGFAAGITIYAPSIILSTILGWNLVFTNLFIGIFVIVYTVSGGTKAVSLTQKQQMAVIMGGMFIAFGLLIHQIQNHIPMHEAWDLAGYAGKLKAIDTSFAFDNQHRYTIWSGIFGAIFLFMSYFGTDQSQVQRYLSGKSMTESRLGLMFNALFKIPMQLFILIVGVMVFVFYQLQPAPLLFNQSATQALEASDKQSQWMQLNERHEALFEERKVLLPVLLAEKDSLSKGQFQTLLQKQKTLRSEAQALLKAEAPAFAKVKDNDFIFLTFVLKYLPHGIIGLLLAVIFSAAMSSTASELNALASITAVDFYQRLRPGERSKQHDYLMSKLFTAMWGAIAIAFSFLAHLLDSLIEAVNILGSIFYGTVLGLFLCAFYIKFLKSNAVFWAGICSQILVFVVYDYYQDEIAFLWYNAIGCLSVIALASLFQAGIFLKDKNISAE